MISEAKIRKHINRDAQNAMKNLRERRAALYTTSIRAIQYATMRAFDDGIIADVAMKLYDIMRDSIQIEQYIACTAAADVCEKLEEDFSVKNYSLMMTLRAVELTSRIEEQELHFKNLIEHIIETKGEPRCPSNTKPSEINFTAKE